MRAKWDALDAMNRRAWNVMQQIASRFVSDLQVGATALAWVAQDVPEDERAELLARLALLYDVLYPPKG